MKKQDLAYKKAKELVASMTLEEAASQLFYKSPAIERLGIPAYNWWNEALHGVARAGTATIFPQAIGMAASFDDALLKTEAKAIAVEARAKYNEQSKRGDRDLYKGVTMWSPNINLFRDPRWGRGQETYGEDPYLTARMGCAFVNGLQGDGEYEITAACAKHFAVHSGPEAIRHSFDAQCSPKDMEETYLPAFEALVSEAKVEGVMGAYNRVNGEGACASSFLMGKLKEWGFDGYFVSDAWAIRDFYEGHKLVPGVLEAAALALKAGCDCNCGNTYPHLMEAYEKGLISEEDIRTACEHLFRTRFRLGLFDENNGFNHFGIKDIATEEHAALALKCAEKSMVLLKNDGILPLKKEKLQSIAVIGPNATSIDALRGNYYGTSCRNVTFLDGIRKEAGNDIRVYYSEGSALSRSRVEYLAEDDDRIAEAKAMAEISDVSILCLGLDANIEGEEGDEGNAFVGGDKTTLEIPEGQKKLLNAVLEIGKPVIVVMAAGSSMNISDDRPNALLQVWYPGEAGGTALANILFGKVSPSAKLPVTFYENTEKLPEFTDYSMSGRTYRYTQDNILYPFGYGLTYSDTCVSGLSYRDGKAIVTAVNLGKTDTEDVVQLYIRDTVSGDEVPFSRLCAFQRIALKAGETREVELAVDPKAFTVVTEEGKRIAGSGSYLLQAGFASPDPKSALLTGHACAQVQIQVSC
ncbi:MAG: glycoside hydrolase family 3 C-terminal domain-containing protein [Oscillospiraceae bacterium]|nr:glycoside hydrolase family 3 C-terminal domain-containing protein [Oscillospiraceae bacterium]